MTKNHVVVDHQNASLLDQEQQIFKLEMELEDKVRNFEFHFHWCAIYNFFFVVLGFFR